MDKKEFLCRYHNLQLRIEKLKDYIEFCHERSVSVGSPVYDGMPHSPNRPTEAPFVKWVYKALDAEQELKDLEAKLEKVKTEIETAISKLTDEEMEQVLIYHYIDWLPWSVIESKMFLSKSSLMRIHRNALEKLNI